MKKLVLTVVAAVALTLAGPASMAHAAKNKTPHCVSKGEYRKAKTGMTEAQVRKIFGPKGTRLSRTTSGSFVAEIRSYKGCSPRRTAVSLVTISFDNEPSGALKLTSKSAIWGR